MKRKALAQALDRFIARLEPLLKSAGSEDYPTHRAADKAVPQWIKDFLTVMKATKQRIVLRDLADAIERRDLARVDELMRWGEVDQALKDAWQPAIVSIMGDAATNAGGTLPPPPRPNLSFRFDLTNPRAVEYAEQHAGELVTQVSQQSRQAIRETVTRAIEEGGHPYVQARRIREVVGLLPRHAQAVDTYRAKLLSDGATQEQADKQAASYAQKLLNYRAKNIARTETINAANQGQLELWRQARDQGYLDASRKKQIVVTQDDRLCDVCAPLDGLVDDLDGDFGGVGDPGFHNSCRCTERLTDK